MKSFTELLREKDPLFMEAMNQSERANIKKEDFVYPEGYDDDKEPKYPIHDEAHAKAAIAYAHNAPDPELVKNAVYKRYPNLKPKAGTTTTSTTKKPETPEPNKNSKSTGNTQAK